MGRYERSPRDIADIQERERERRTASSETENEMETQRVQEQERTRVLRRCAVTDDPYFQMYYIPPVLLSALVCSASSEISVAMACRRGGSCVVLRGASKKKKNEEQKEEVEEMVEEGSEREASGRAITGNEMRGEKMMVASTPRTRAYIYLCVASRCWAFVVPDDGRLSRETTSEAFASSPFHLFLLLLLLFLLLLTFSLSLSLAASVRSTLFNGDR